VTDVHVTGAAIPAVPLLQRTDIEALAADLAALTRSDANALRLQWRRLYRAHPPRTLSRDLLELAVAWKLQERALGGLSATTRRQLAELARTLAARSGLAKLRKVTLKPGARLMRAWGGETHEVVVVDNGFLWRDKTWNSLSVIAREITSTRWSGPRFFGLDRTNTGALGSGGISGGPANE
jgi:hypothetical protein